MGRKRGTVWLAAVLLAVASAAGAQEARRSPQPSWYRGNLHTHTINSDGNASPDTVVRWYREHGYQFVVITDHEFLTDVEPLNALFGAEGRFLVMRGQEVTQRLYDGSHPDGMREAHVNAIGARRVVMPVGGPEDETVAVDHTMAELYARNIEAIREAGGLAQINHPNWRWSARLEDLLGVPEPVLFEIWNGHPAINNLGGTDGDGRRAPSAEELWDALLSRGKTVWGVAVDDSHDFQKPDDAESVGPGRAWVVVRAAELTPEAITAALRRGDFYASNGIRLEDYTASTTEISITIEQQWDARYLTRFIGSEGRVLAEVQGLEPRYTVGGDEGYVRASIVDSNGHRAWTQPLFLGGRKIRD